MRAVTLYRYPVKSMLGEAVESLFVNEQGVQGDRRLALIDQATGRIASAKQARLWRSMLQCTATLRDGRVSIALPDGTTVASDDEDVDDRLSHLLSRAVHLADRRPPDAAIDRADPDQVLDRGLDAEVESQVLELAEATPGESFVDFAPLHAITTATLEQAGVEAERYRPNLVIETDGDVPAYGEKEWIDRVLVVGETRMRVLGHTPRCVIPTLEHGALPRATQALRIPAAQNRLQAFDFGVLPCAGVYLDILGEGMIRSGDPVAVV